MGNTLLAWMKYPGGNGGQQGETVTYSYHPQMLVKNVYSSSFGYYYLQNATYDAAGRTDILELGLNAGASYMYLDYNYYAWNVQGGRLQWLQANQTAGYLPRQKLEYAYDAAGNVDWIKDHLAGVPDEPYQLQDFTYDLLNRLDAASASGGDGQGLYNERYDYDSQGNLWKKGTVNQETVYTYLDGSHKHAVTHLGGTQKYWYDANGNMSTRTVGTTGYSQGWDAENRLVSVSGGGITASYTYDGDGVRVKGTVNGAVTAYVGNWFEWTGSTGTMKKYYDAGSQRIAMRTGSGTGTIGLLWVIGDHLGSTTKVANYDGTLNSQRRYKPWGEARFGDTLPTTYRYTGQRQEDQLGGTDGLYYYGARWLDPALGRWLSPDSIIPEAAQGVQAWSRYTYVNNSPTRYQDPTGHAITCGNESGHGCDGDGGLTPRDIVYGNYDDPQAVLRGYLIHHPGYQPDLDPELSGDRLTYSTVATAMMQVSQEGNASTLAIGITAIGGSTVVGRFDAYGAVDTEGNADLFYSQGLGGAYPLKPYISVGPTLTITNAPSIEKLTGRGTSFGWLVAPLPLGFALSAEMDRFTDPINSTIYTGLSLSVSYSASANPMAGTFYATGTTTHYAFR